MQYAVLSEDFDLQVLWGILKTWSSSKESHRQCFKLITRDKTKAELRLRPSRQPQTKESIRVRFVLGYDTRDTDAAKYWPSTGVRPNFQSTQWGITGYSEASTYTREKESINNSFQNKTQQLHNIEVHWETIADSLEKIWHQSLGYDKLWLFSVHV